MTDKISLRDIYNAVNSLEEKLDRRFLKVEEDIENLKDFKGRLTGIMAIVSLIASGAFSYIWKKIEG